MKSSATTLEISAEISQKLKLEGMPHSVAEGLYSIFYLGVQPQCTAEDLVGPFPANPGSRGVVLCHSIPGRALVNDPKQPGNLGVPCGVSRRAPQHALPRHAALVHCPECGKALSSTSKKPRSLSVTYWGVLKVHLVYYTDLGRH